MHTHSLEILDLIRSEILAHEGFLPFERYMHLALYAPGLGYYTRAVPMGQNTDKGIDNSDFVTAPELTSLFGQTLARQIAQLFEQGLAPQILEFGAGTGKLALDILLALGQLGFRDIQYQILDISSLLRERQKTVLKSFGSQVQWLDELPASFEGIMLGNEVLDAMPVSVFALRGNSLFERGVGLEKNLLIWKEKKVDQETYSAIVAGFSEQSWLKRRINNTDEIFSSKEGDNSIPYFIEIAWQAQAFVQTLSKLLQKGALFLIDYGFPAAEFYHWQRHMGTLMSFSRHRTHSDVLYAPGQQDITAHINFSAIAQAAAQGGAELAGYVNQARFLMNCGLLELAAAVPQDDKVSYTRSIAAVQKLLSEAEMGELFKVIAFTKRINTPLMGFKQADRSASL